MPIFATHFKTGYRDSGNLKQKITMSKLHFTTKHANEATVTRNWYVVDGTNQTVGRMCARIAAILRGKNKACYTPHVDTGDYIIVINCEKVVLTGKKLDQKCMILSADTPVAVRKNQQRTCKNAVLRS